MTVSIEGTTPGIAVDGTGAVVNVTVTTGAGGGGGGVELGETSTTAYRGDRGKTAYDHSQVTTGNPHGTTAADVGADPAGTAAGLVDDLSGVSNQATARTNLGLGTAATAATGDFAAASHTHTGTQVSVDASGFNGNLTTSDDTVQEVAQKLDDLVIPAAGIADPGGANDDFLQRKSGAWANRTIAQVKTDLGVTSEIEHAPGFATAWWFTDTGVGVSSSSLHYLSAAGYQTWLPVRLTPGTYDRIAVHSTVAAVSTWRLGIDSSTSQFRPGTNLLDAGTVNMNATAGTQAITISFVVAATDWFWLRVKCDAFTASPTAFAAHGLTDSRESIAIGSWPTYAIGGARSFAGLNNSQNAGSGAFAAPPSFTGNAINGIGYSQGVARVYLRRSA